MKKILLFGFLLAMQIMWGQGCWKTISAGSYHTVAIKNDGTLWAWGYNSYGQLGDGSNVNKNIPTQIGTDNNWKDISAGKVHTIAIKSDGTLWAWGSNYDGQLGDGTNIDKNIPSQVGITNDWKSITTGSYHSMAIKTNGSLWTWGNNLYGQLGDGTRINKNNPVKIGNDYDWLTISGSGHSIAIKSNGTLWVWGNNGDGQLGDGNHDTSNVLPKQIGSENTWKLAVAGGRYTIALKNNGTLWAWGSNFYGQLGDGTNISKYMPVQIGYENNWKSADAGEEHNLAIKNDGTLWVWGSNGSGQLGDGTGQSRNTPNLINALPYCNSISAGNFYSSVIRTDGSLWIWGDNYYGQLGNGTNTGSNIPIAVNGCTSSTSCITWTDGAPDSTFLPPDQNTAFQYLCSNAIIENQQVKADIDNPIKREEIAKVAFRGLYKPNVNAVTFADYLPSPFIDLQTSAYKKEALALSYLEYGDGISAFNRNFTHFRPKETISRQHALKLLMETLNIKPAASGTAPTWGSGVFTDVNGTTNFEMYYYLVKAYQLGFISSETQFRPNDNITRRELFVWLYKMLNSNTYAVPSDNDYYTTGNITPSNFGRMLSINDGNFNSYSKTSFNLDGLMPLNFSHSYNSLLTELPDGYTGLEPLGKGWTHNYNCYIREVNGGLDGATTIEPRTLIYWGDGTMNSFKKTDGNYIAETIGLYATLTKSADENLYEFTTKNKVRYIFSKQPTGYWVLTYIKDRNNNTTSLSWANNMSTSKPRLNWVETPGGRKLNFTYVSGTDLINTVSETGLNRSVSFTYTNSNTDLNTFTDPKGNITTYIYDNVADPKVSHLLKQIQLPKGNIVNNTYLNRKLQSTALVGQYQTNVNQNFNYNGGNSNNFYQTAVTTSRDGQNITTTSQLNQLGNISSVATPLSNISIGYGDSSQPTKPTVLNNATTGLTGDMMYDSNGNVTQIKKTGGAINITETFTYNNFNDVISHTDGNGHTTTYTYNSSGNLTQVKDALNHITQITPNADGTTQKITNPEGIYTSFTYNAYGNTTNTSLMGSINNQVSYDGASRAVSTVNANGVATALTYELNDMIKKVTVDPSGLNNIVQYGYDANDNLTSVTNPMNGITQLDYNNQDQVTQYSFAGRNKNYTYNNDGTLKTFKDQNNVTFTNVYNADGTLQTDGYATYTYNADKTVNTITRNSKTITFGYDALKRIVQVKYNDFALNDSNGVKYTYDNNDNITAIEYPDGFKVGYEYDAADRLTRVYNFANSSNFAEYTYLSDGRLQQQTNGNGTKTIYSYDSYGRISGISNQKNDGTIIYAQNYTMDNLGNHLSETTTEPFAPSAADINNATIAYTHDSGNRMLSRDSDQYTYDGNGNQISSTAVNNPVYTYDPKDNLLTCSFPSITCEYDALENRRKRNTTLFVLDILGGNNVLMETNSSGTPSAYYIHGLGLITRLDAVQANPSYYHYDYRGSTATITNSSQNVTHSYKYGPYGEMMGSTDNGFINTYRYVGKYGVQFEGSQLYFMRARYYNPMQGRFLGEDPIWNTNLYAYCGNNPIIRIDPSGEYSESVPFLATLAEKLPETINRIRNSGTAEMTNQLILQTKLELYNLSNSANATAADKQMLSDLSNILSSSKNVNESINIIQNTFGYYLSEGVNGAKNYLTGILSGAISAAQTVGVYLAAIPSSTIITATAGVVGAVGVGIECYYLFNPDKLLNVLQNVAGEKNGNKIWSFIYGVKLN